MVRLSVPLRVLVQTLGQLARSAEGDVVPTVDLVRPDVEALTGVRRAHSTVNIRSSRQRR